MSDLAERVEQPPQRNIAVDAYRGLVMLLMMGEVLQFGQVARSFPTNPIWQFLGYNQSHVEWAGMSLHDTIQPGFTFLVGVALPYSLLSRQRKGESFAGCCSILSGAVFFWWPSASFSAPPSAP
jgi:predicted acyltransferase